MKTIDRYVKQEKSDKLDAVQRSINIETRHKEFLERNNLNLSAMVRDMLDAAMAKVKGGKL